MSAGGLASSAALAACRDKLVEVVAPQLLALAEKIAPLIPKQGLRTPGLIRVEEPGAAHDR